MRVAPFPPVKQRMGLGDVMEVGRRRDQCMYPAGVGIHPDMGLHAKPSAPNHGVTASNRARNRSRCFLLPAYARSEKPACITQASQ